MGNDATASRYGQELVAALRETGFDVVRIRVSHVILGHPDGRVTVVPLHSGEIIGLGLLAKILKDVDLSPQQLQAFLKHT